MNHKNIKFGNSNSLKDSNLPLNTNATNVSLKGQSQSQFSKQLVMATSSGSNSAPNVLKQRNMGIYLVLLSIPILFILLYELYRRLEGKSFKRIRQGERRENDKVRYYSEAEKYTNERQSWSYKLFGKDWFLDGFTSKTMCNQKKEDKEK